MWPFLASFAQGACDSDERAGDQRDDDLMRVTGGIQKISDELQDRTIKAGTTAPKARATSSQTAT